MKTPTLTITFMFAWTTLLLSGCISGRLFESANQRYAEAFADAANHDLLLNIARLANDEPAYFIQLGTFSTVLTVSGTAAIPGTGTGYTKNRIPAGATSGVKEAYTLGGTLGTTVTEAPNFQFVPLAGDQFSQTIFAPVQGILVSAIYAGEWPADVLMRVMVTDVELLPKKDSGNAPLILRNDPRDPHYPHFIALCYELRRAQIAHEVNASVDVDPKSKPIEYYDVCLADGIKADTSGYKIANGREEKPVTGVKASHAYEVYRSVQLKIPSDPVSDEAIRHYPVLSQILVGYDLRWHLRSFENALYEIAQEERRFSEAGASVAVQDIKGLSITKTALRPPDAAEQGPSMEVEAQADGRDQDRFLVRPILRILDYKPDHVLAALDHHGRHYVVGDRDAEHSLLGEQGPPVSPSTSNRVVFTLLCYWFTQASVDSTKLPVQQTIQVR